MSEEEERTAQEIGDKLMKGAEDPNRQENAFEEPTLRESAIEILKENGGEVPNDLHGEVKKFVEKVAQEERSWQSN